MLFVLISRNASGRHARSKTYKHASTAIKSLWRSITSRSLIVSPSDNGSLPGVDDEKPPHPAAHLAVGVRPVQMEEVGHHPVSSDVDGQSGTGVGRGPDEGIVVGRLMEGELPTIAPIEGTIPHVGDRGSCGPGHASTQPSVTSRLRY